MKKYLADYAYLLSISGVIILFDQYTKWLVQTNLAFEETWAPWDWLMPYARIVHWSNTGSAFGMFQGLSTILGILAVIVSAAILFYFPQVPREEKFLRFAMSLQLGGALGNLVDRIRQGYVTDFVSVGTFPVWNVADASISCGVVVLLVGLWITDRKKKIAVQAEKADGSSGSDEISEDPK